MSVASIYKRFEGLCVYCGIAVRLTGPKRVQRQLASRDHFIPVSLGGAKGVANQVLACRGCNSDKGHIDPRTLVQVWHRLDADGLRAFVRRLDDAAVALRMIDERAAEQAAAAGRVPPGTPIVTPSITKTARPRYVSRRSYLT